MYEGRQLWKTEALEFLFSQNALVEPEITPKVIERYIDLDDNDILVAVKQWRRSGDKTLELLCGNLLSRNLLKARYSDDPIPEHKVQELRMLWHKRLGVSEQEIRYFVFTGDISNMAYLPGPEEPIEIAYKDGQIKNIAEASDMHNIEALSNPVKKYFVCYPNW
jgi:uncharacterized protein